MNSGPTLTPKAQQPSTKQPTDPAPSNMLGGYAPMDGVSDELVGPDGNMRPAWRSFMDFFQDLSPAQIARRFARGDQYLRDAGVFYRQYDAADQAERDWPLSHLPVILSHDDWQSIESGLKQRADLLEAMMADLYGPMTLVENGHLPADLIAAAPGWLLPMTKAARPDGHYLNFLAFEIGRGPDGTWWVLGDRTEAPAGAGFALENRVATSQVFPDLYRQSSVIRLSDFFRNFRDHLLSLAGEDDNFGFASNHGGIGILTPGRLNEGYFEHAYIARYLGLMLLEGEDIAVRDGKALIRTVDGLKPISVLWRRMDSAFIDPLELNAQSFIGTPGLANVVRQGHLNMINWPGSGILESRSMLAFMPRICEALTGQSLQLPNIATWWCGQETARDYAISQDHMVFGHAHMTSLPFERNEMSSMGRKQDQSALKQLLERDGGSYVAQEAIKLSSTPVYEDGRLVPRPMTIRVFLARTHQGWSAMPGGYARIGNQEGETILALQGGGKVADVWVYGDEKHPPADPVGQTTTDYVRKRHEVLPSRAADNLFWLGRYIERAEWLTRMTRAFHIRLEESDGPKTPLIRFFAAYLDRYGIGTEEIIPATLVDALNAAMISAGHLRDRFSTDGWMALKDLSDTAQSFQRDIDDSEDVARAVQILLRKISGFSGLVHDSMYHYTGWRFMKIGRALERATVMTAALHYFMNPKAPVGALDIPVDIGDSMITHRRRYTVTTNRDTVVDLLALDQNNPRSVLYQVNDIRQHLGFLPGENDPLHMSDLSRAILRLQTDLSVMPPRQVSEKFLTQTETALFAFSDQLSLTWLK